jgi:hypothetical protein
MHSVTGDVLPHAAVSYTCSWFVSRQRGGRARLGVRPQGSLWFTLCAGKLLPVRCAAFDTFEQCLALESSDWQ